MLERDFLAFLNHHQLTTSGQAVLLAVSGGLDSMVMAELFYQTQQPFAIAHVNFGLRASESEADALFVEHKAQSYGVPFHLHRVDTQTYASGLGISIQMAARELRYAWFSQLCQLHSYAYVATAHHLNDVLETVLLNLTRGTGLAGLHGIAVQQNGVVRPLLFATRAQLAAYADENQLPYREDSSNAEDKYARNRLRHHVVPVLEAINPAIWQTLPRTLERLRTAESFVESALEQSWAATAIVEGDRILLPTDRIKSLPAAAFRLASWLKPFGFTTDQVSQLLGVLDTQTGQVFKTATHQITHERAGLLLLPLATDNAYQLTLDNLPSAPVLVGNKWSLTMERVEKPAAVVKLTNTPMVAYLDADRLVFPLTIRPWQQGDRFQPLGMKGTKLVSDVLTDGKVNRSEREQTPVLLSAHQIAWVIGHRIGHPFRIRPETTQVFRLVWQLQVNESHESVS